MPDKMTIAVTGMGAVTPFGIGVDVFWERLRTGQSAIGAMKDEALARFAPVAAQLQDFAASELLGKKEARNTDRFTQLALVAGHEALQDAGLTEQVGGVTTVDQDDFGIAVGTAFGGVQSLEEGSAALATGAATRVSPRLVSKSIPNAAAAALAKQYGFRGPAITYVTACASSANAIGEAAYWLQSGRAKAVLAGGAEMLFTPSIMAGLRAAGAIAVDGPADWQRWSRPFDVNRKGMVMSEGAAFLVLEPLEQAQARDAKVYGVLSGYGASNDAYHETAPEPQGAGALLAMTRALKSAGLSPEDIGYINAHATATPAGDAAEASALRQLFGNSLDHIPVSSIKGAVGHMLGTAGAIESVACLKALQTGWLPPTINCDDPDEGMPADVVPVSRDQDVRHMLSNSFGFGGQNGVLIWSKT